MVGQKRAGSRGKVRSLALTFVGITAVKHAVGRAQQAPQQRFKRYFGVSLTTAQLA